jgi:acetyl-CoA carboxylase biotin carboxyl carrier protein
MDAQQIKILIDAMASSDLAEMEASKDGWRLRLVRQAAPPAAPAAAPHSAPVAPRAAGTREQCAALCGAVFLQPAPGEPHFVQVGQAVKAGQTLCVIEAMKIFNEVQAEHDGIVEAFLVDSGQDVDAGQPLVRLR